MAKGKFKNSPQKPQNQSGVRKALNIVKSILVWMIVAVAVFMVIFTVVISFYFGTQYEKNKG